MQPLVLLALRLNPPYSFSLIRLLPPSHFFLSWIHVLYDPLSPVRAACMCMSTGSFIGT